MFNDSFFVCVYTFIYLIFLFPIYLYVFLYTPFIGILSIDRLVFLHVFFFFAINFCFVVTIFVNYVMLSF